MDYIVIHGYDRKAGVVREIRLWWCADCYDALEEAKRKDAEQ
ncbi:MAG TPA: hypothetical protein VN577_09950 [Terriglobales bacterium]|nr:hypothetical protein [Terriglobales bacterium]